MANIAHTSLPEYTPGLLNPADWSNKIHSILAYASVRNSVEKVTLPIGSPVVGKIYLASAASTGGFNGGNIYIWLSPTGSAQGFSPDPGCVMGIWTKNNAGTDWENTDFSNLKNGGTFLTNFPSPLTLTLPNSFDGLATIISYGNSLIINQAGGRTAKGNIGVSLTNGIYQVYQDANIAII
jgi:hypothetical protein